MRLIPLIFFSILCAAAYGQRTTKPSLYQHFFPDHSCSRQAFDLAWKGYQNLLRQHLITVPGYLSIVDYSIPSDRKRLFVLRLKDTTVAVSSIVSHGIGSDPDSTSIPYLFGNYEGSKMSSLGFYLTGNTYTNFRPDDNLGLCLFGLDKGYNDSAAAREIVFHYGATERKGTIYVTDSGAGRSYGCPALPLSTNRQIIELIRGGTVVFVYSNRDPAYVRKSSVLNGTLLLPIYQKGPPPNNCECLIR